MYGECTVASYTTPLLTLGGKTKGYETYRVITSILEGP